MQSAKNKTSRQLNFGSTLRANQINCKRRLFFKLTLRLDSGRLARQRQLGRCCSEPGGLARKQVSPAATKQEHSKNVSASQKTGIGQAISKSVAEYARPRSKGV